MKHKIVLQDDGTGHKFSFGLSSDTMTKDIVLLIPEENGTILLEENISKYISENLANSFKGYTGSQGYTGSRGIAGYTGSQGVSGSQGIIGYTGSQGIPGQGLQISAIFNSLAELLAGSTTDQTFAMVAGTLPITSLDYGKLYLRKNNTWTYITDMSVEGAAGVQGPIGFTGSQGVQGIIGFTGSQGVAGTAGSIGYTGSIGTNGATGYTGSKGDTGVLEKRLDLATGTVINLALANLFTKTISGNTTFTVSNLAAANNTNSFVLELTNGGSGIITWWSGMKWAGGTAPTLTTAGTDILGFYSYDAGTTWRGVLLSLDSK